MEQSMQPDLSAIDEAGTPRALKTPCLAFNGQLQNLKRRLGRQTSVSAGMHSCYTQNIRK